MKNIIKVAVIGLFCGVSQVALADVSAIKSWFGGGCLSSNLTSGCTIKSQFEGFDLDKETAALYTCTSQEGSCTLYSPRVRRVDSTGKVVMRIKNIPGGCFQVRTGRNGNNRPDAKSKILCEK
ncbi:hypothetical protein UFOVP410_54 [uncultured Caudovirales phage]|uniref:Uncharacterized protein n=1 Tax=uncultured Caudovirales phage TaxID=2100421 RepID=A0A6J5M2Q7_9CAUD|nr:hypothetical protein UFOVP410_54 [uncultured Caudovirales phage]